MINVFNLHITNLCNYQCKYCFGKFPNKAEMTCEQAFAVVDAIARYFEKNGISDGRINLAGGEPLMCKHIDDLIDYINAYGIKVSVITNGSLLSVERIAGWANKVSCIGISIDSALEETNKAIGRCCNNKTLTVKQLVRITQAIHRNKIKLKINIVVSKLNAKENMTVLLKRLKPERVKILQMTVVDGINNSADKYAIREKEFDEFYKRHKHCCCDVVRENAKDMENSYLMINPQGEVQINDNGKYVAYWSCFEEELDVILDRVRIDVAKFNARYGKEKATECISKKICVFGGHPTWIKIMEKSLINAKFFKDDNLHSLDSIRNAEEIWIQSNAISHSFYGKVLDVARLNGIPVRYFRFSGTKKCKEQVI